MKELSAIETQLRKSKSELYTIKNQAVHMNTELSTQSTQVKIIWMRGLIFYNPLWRPIERILEYMQCGADKKRK